MTGRTRPEAVRWGCHVHRTPAGTPCQHCAAQGELSPRTDARPGRRKPHPTNPTGRRRYDEAVEWGIATNRHRDWPKGNHPDGYNLATRLRDKAEQVWLFTRNLAVPWTNNASEQALKGPKRHQAVSGYWHTLSAEHPRGILPCPFLPGQRPRPQRPRHRRHP